MLCGNRPRGVSALKYTTTYGLVPIFSISCIGASSALLVCRPHFGAELSARSPEHDGHSLLSSGAPWLCKADRTSPRSWRSDCQAAALVVSTVCCMAKQSFHLPCHAVNVL